MNSSLLRCFYQFIWSYFITQARDKCQKQLWQPDNIVCNKQLIDLFLEDEKKKIVFVFLRMKIKVVLGGVIHPISPKISHCRSYWADSKNSSGIWKPWKNCRGFFYWPLGHEWRHRSGQSQNVRHFGLGDKSQLIGMDSVSDICKYHLLCFVSIIEVKVISGHQVKKGQAKISLFRGAIPVFRSDFPKEREKWP